MNTINQCLQSYKYNKKNCWSIERIANLTEFKFDIATIIHCHPKINEQRLYFFERSRWRLEIHSYAAQVQVENDELSPEKYMERWKNLANCHITFFSNMSHHYWSGWLKLPPNIKLISLVFNKIHRSQTT